MNSASFLAVLLAAAILGWSLNHSHKNQETSNFETKLSELYKTVAEVVEEGAVVLLIKFLNFCVAKFAEIRYLSLTQMASYSTASILFWVILTRSVFDLYN
uniref:Uncharacterized protein n=1 Tax=Kalanchoe fedtschenkoi TaxID=63787 RepID=A0A7N0USC4_KALFE